MLVFDSCMWTADLILTGKRSIFHLKWQTEKLYYWQTQRFAGGQTHKYIISLVCSSVCMAEEKKKRTAVPLPPPQQWGSSSVLKPNKQKHSVVAGLMSLSSLIWFKKATWKIKRSNYFIIWMKTQGTFCYWSTTVFYVLVSHLQHPLHILLHKVIQDWLHLNCGPSDS